MYRSNTCDMYEGFCIGCRNTAESFLFLFTVSLPPLHNQRYMRLIVYYHYLASAPTPSCNKRHHTYNYVTCSNVNARNSRTSSDVPILHSVRNVIR
jgi:hypothetical protein